MTLFLERQLKNCFGDKTGSDIGRFDLSTLKLRSKVNLHAQMNHKTVKKSITQEREKMAVLTTFYENQPNLRFPVNGNLTKIQLGRCRSAHEQNINLTYSWEIGE